MYLLWREVAKEDQIELRREGKGRICVNFAHFGLNGLDTVAGANGDKNSMFTDLAIGFKEETTVGQENQETLNNFF